MTYRVSARATAKIIGCTDRHLGHRPVHRTPLGERDQGGDIRLFVEGLPEGRHAVHIHEVASCQPCAEAGGHFDPGPNGNSSPDGNHPFHRGDLIDIVVTPAGRGRLWTTTRFTLSPGPLSLFESDGSVFTFMPIPTPSARTGRCPDAGESAGRVVGSSTPTGDGDVTPPELCDDSATTNGDGCSSTCRTEIPIRAP